MQVTENEIYRKIGGSKNLPNFHFFNKSKNGKEIKQKKRPIHRGRVAKEDYSKSMVITLKSRIRVEGATRRPLLRRLHRRCRCRKVRGACPRWCAS